MVKPCGDWGWYVWVYFRFNMPKTQRFWVWLAYLLKGETKDISKTWMWGKYTHTTLTTPQWWKVTDSVTEMAFCSALYLGSSRAIKIWLHINGANIRIQFYKYNKQTPNRLAKTQNQENMPSTLTFTTTNLHRHHPPKGLWMRMSSSVIPHTPPISQYCKMDYGFPFNRGKW